MGKWRKAKLPDIDLSGLNEALERMKQLPEDFPFEVTRYGLFNPSLASRRYVSPVGRIDTVNDHFAVVAASNYTTVPTTSGVQIAAAARLLAAEAKRYADDESRLGKYPPKVLFPDATETS